MNQWLLKKLLGIWLGYDRLAWYNQLDWHQAISTFQQPELSYPDYYSSQNFHGIREGYLNPIAAITYDPVTKLASPPHEGWLRRQLLTMIKGQPQQILDLGCGTGSSTLLLKQAFPNAAVVGLDLSPYMLVMADYKAQQAGLEIQWQQGLAEASGWESTRFDLVTASFLFHEMPPAASQAVLRESWRLLKPGGQILILDGSQRILRHLGWLIDLFREPYSRVYAAECVQGWLNAAGFATVRSHHRGLIHQITTGHRPHH
ncbi:MAG: class I SAM-dependent methyltransferase [Thainema sp.]